MRPDELERGRAFFERRAWTDAYTSLARADREGALRPDDLELLATAAYMVGRDEEQQSALERAHRVYLDRGEPLAAVRCAFWLSVHQLLRRKGASRATEVAREGGIAAPAGPTRGDLLNALARTRATGAQRA